MTLAFWKTIERIPGHASDTRDWCADLAACWTNAKRYLPETSRYEPEPLHPPEGGVGGLHCVNQLKLTGLPLGSMIRNVLDPSPASKSVTRMVLPACTGSIWAR